MIDFSSDLSAVMNLPFPCTFCLHMQTIQCGLTRVDCFLFVVGAVIVLAFAFVAITRNIIESPLKADGMLMLISPELSLSSAHH